MRTNIIAIAATIATLSSAQAQQPGWFVVDPIAGVCQGDRDRPATVLCRP